MSEIDRKEEEEFMILSDLFLGIDHEVLQGNMQADIDEIVTNSKEVTKNSAFAAVKGHTLDGHTFIGQVLEAGCKVVFVESGATNYSEWMNHPELTLISIPKGQKTLAKLASRLYNNPSSQFNLIGVTGTNGKTSIAQLLGTCLTTLGQVNAVLGTTGNRIGDVLYPTTNTTLEAVKLQKLFKQMAEYPIEVGVMEVSSHAMTLDRVAEVQFDYGIFSNLTEDHLDFHESMEAYYHAKKSFFEQVEKASIINYDDAYGREIFLDLLKNGDLAYSYGLSNESDFYAEIHEMTAAGTHLTAYFPGEKVTVFMPLPGKIYVYNLMAVLSMLYLLGYEMTDMEKAVASIKSVEGRLETLSTEAQGAVIVDFAHTPDALDKVIDVCREFTKGKLITVFGCGGDRDRLKRPVMGKIATDKSDCVILTSDNPRTENSEQIVQDIVAGVEDSRKSILHVETDRKLAIEMGLKMINEGDTLLIAGKGHETYQIIGTEKRHFDDREEAVLAAKRLFGK